MRRTAPAAILVVLVALMAWCARTPEAGTGWRLGFVLSALLASGALVWSMRVHRPSMGTLLGVAVGLRLLVLPLAPTLSDDGYRYLWDGYAMTQGINPYAETPRELAARGVDIPIELSDLNSPDYHSVYPPVSQAFFAASAWGGGASFSRAWWLYKLLLVSVEVLGVWALARALPDLRLELYAWHPLAVMEIAGQGHTEGLVIGFLALGLAALLRQRQGASGVWLAVAGWVKLWPFVILSVWGQHRVRLALTSSFVALVLLVPLALGAGGALESLGLYAGTFDFYSLPYAVLKSAIWPLASDSAGRIATAVLWLSGILIASVIAFLAWRRNDSLQLATGGVVIAITLASSTLHPWHLLPALWAAAIFGKGRGTHAIMWLVTWSAVTYLVYVGIPGAQMVAMLIGWLGAALFGVLYAIPWVLERRGASKWARVRPMIPDRARGRLLDLGGAEGFVAAAAHRNGYDVVVADLEDVRQTDVPFIKVVAERVESVDGAFASTLLVFVLHHADAPERLLVEAKRVSTQSLVVWETTPRRWFPEPLLQFVDQIANHLRPSGHGFPAANLRSPAQWEVMFDRVGLRICSREDWGVLHPQTLWHLRCTKPSAEAETA